eukprot:TRINITY_DN3170_c0_g1_i1.p2 TRINITY_DN3170_c0_g1~~TRINITY_DN3170_c0_g1_i1.p2  ORF type:complete len:181 (+),score=7.16 TRINITY_DN3170_c0_g1_i1:1537-2079(+)
MSPKRKMKKRRRERRRGQVPWRVFQKEQASRLSFGRCLNYQESKGDGLPLRGPSGRDSCTLMQDGRWPGTPSHEGSTILGGLWIPIDPSLWPDFIWVYSPHAYKQLEHFNPRTARRPWATLDENGGRHIDLAAAQQEFPLRDPCLHWGFRMLGASGERIGQLRTQVWDATRTQMNRVGGP